MASRLKQEADTLVLAFDAFEKDANKAMALLDGRLQKAEMRAHDVSAMKSNLRRDLDQLKFAHENRLLDLEAMKKKREKSDLKLCEVIAEKSKIAIEFQELTERESALKLDVQELQKQ